MIFSDFHLNKETKIEILPSDRLDQKVNFIVPGDRLISVFRGVGSPFVADRMHKYFAAEFQSYFPTDNLTIDEALSKTLSALNISCLCPPCDPDMVPKSGAMALVVYIDSNNKMTFAQVGSITLKQRKDGKFVALTENHNDELSRFLGHPDLCGLGSEYGEKLISTKPFVGTCIL